MLISVVICTYNRADLLALALETLCQQNLDTTLFEVIVVDNNSPDNTKAVTESFMAKQDNIHYVLETEQGLSYARNRGWQDAKSDYIAYCDDDCKLPAQWLSVAADIIKQHQPAVFGGGIIPFYLNDRPDWFKDTYESHILQQPEGALQSSEFLSGNNLFIQRDYLIKLDGFRTNLGMTKDKIAYSEETFFMRMIKARYPEALMYYHPDLIAYHAVRPEKMLLSWRLRACFAAGRDKRMLRELSQAETRNDLQIIIGRITAFFIIGTKLIIQTLATPFRNRQTYPHWQTYIYEILCPTLKSAGDWWTQVKMYYQNRTRA